MAEEKMKGKKLVELQVEKCVEQTSTKQSVMSEVIGGLDLNITKMMRREEEEQPEDK